MDAVTLRRRFIDTRWLTQEHDRLWSRCWVAAVPAVCVQKAGDVVVSAVGPFPVLIVHDGEAVRSFHNVCPHRGHPLCTADGHHKRLRCPYHHWTFALNGRRLRRPDPGDFADEGHGLSPLTVEVFAGLIWLRVAADGPSLSDWLGAAASLLVEQGLERMSLTSHVFVELACNWKLSVEVHLESYHVHALHAEVLGWVDDTAATVSAVGRHGAMTVPMAQPSGRLSAPNDLVAQQLARLGVDPAGMDLDAQRAAFGAASLAALQRKGADVTGLTAERLVENRFLQLFPNVQLNGYGDRIMLFRHHPHPTDPTRCRFEQQIFERTSGSPVRAAQPRQVSPDDAAIGPVTAADLHVAQHLQRSAVSPAFAPDWSTQEILVRRFHEAVADFIAEEP
ncbi:MAG: aromatic ring-hydroxylating dioxygenase subunit alpha [Myxococcota bacterium]